MAELAIEFRTFAAESSCNDEAHHGAFLNALSDNLKDEMASRDLSCSLNDLINLAIRVDNRLCEHRRERAGKVSPFQRSFTSTSTTFYSAAIPAPPLAPHQSFAEPEPMQLGSAHLDEERQRHMNTRSCLYCGPFVHFFSTCLVRPAKGAAQH